MKSWIPKLGLKEGKKKVNKENPQSTHDILRKHEDSSKEGKKKVNKENPQSTHDILWKHEDSSIPSTPRLERSRNGRRHLTKIQSFQLVPNRSYDVRPESTLPSVSEPVSPRRYGTSDNENHSLQLGPRYGPSSDGSISSDTCVSSGSDLESYGVYCESTGTTQSKSQSTLDVLRSSPDSSFEGIHAIYEESVESTCCGTSPPVPATPRNMLEEPTKIEGMKGRNICPSYQGISRATPNNSVPDHGWMNENAHKIPAQSPRSHLSGSRLTSPHKTPLQSPRSTLLSPRQVGLGWHDDSQHGHPLPLPPALSPRSVSPSVKHNMLDDSGRLDPQSPSTPWSRSSMVADGKCGQWIKGALLGSGSFGKVYKGIHRETGDMCAIKEVELVADDPRSNESAKQLAQEIMLLSKLRHKNILHYKGSETIGNSLYIYLELVSGGSIYKLLQEFENKIPESVIRRYTRQILLGLSYLHGQQTVHRDIKCANVLVDQDGVVKLADFGMAKLIGNEKAQLSFKGSPYWMAPEVIQQNNAGFEVAVDIWSLGCTVIEMATGKPPWFQYEGYAAMFKVINCHDVPIPDTLSPIGREFIRLCLQKDPEKRPTASTLLCHPFVRLDRFMPSNRISLSEAVIERMTLREYTTSDIDRDRATIQPTLSDSAIGSTTHTKRRAGHVSPQPSFQALMHVSQSVPVHSNISNSQLVPGNRIPISSKRFTGNYEPNIAKVRLVDHHGNESREISRTATPISSKRFTSKYEPNIRF